MDGAGRGIFEMKNTEVMEVQARQDRGTNANRRLRSEGMLPAIVYGMGLDPFPVAVAERSVEEILDTEAGRNSIFTLSLAGADGDNSRAVMIKDLQRDPVSERLLHVDFVRVDLDKTVQVQVPIHVVGVAFGVRNEGALMDFILREVTVECLPGDIPERFEVDVTDLHLNQQAHVSDLTVGERVKLLDDPKTTLVSIVPPKAAALAVEEEEAAEAEAEAEAAEEGEGAEAEKPEGTSSSESTE